MATDDAAPLRQVPTRVWIVALVVVVGLIGAAIAVALTSTGSGSESTASPRTPPATAPVTQEPTTRTEPPTTIPTTTTLAPGEDRLSTASRLGFAGLGPIKLGMSFDEASRVGQVSFESDGCSYVIVPQPGSGLELDFGVTVSYRGQPNVQEISIGTPAISTISGIRIGSTREEVLQTYPYAVTGSDPDTITITNSEARTITFVVSMGRVFWVFLWQEGQRAPVDYRC